MEEACSLEGCISMGPWGGPGGKKWSYRFKGGIKQVVIVRGGAIDSIVFKSDDGNGLMECSMKFGGDGGGQIDEVDIDWPVEYLTGISGSYESYYPCGPVAIRSLCFYTNHTKHGPFGSNNGTRFSIPMEGGVIVGFHGRAHQLLHAIGVYAQPRSSFCVPGEDFPKNQEVINEMKLDVPRDPGPWGGVGGKPWDDGIFSATKQVFVHVGNGVIHSLQFEYEKMDGKTIWSQKHGGQGGDKMNRIKLECRSEFLVGITGFYGPIKGNDGFEAIRSISFYTNKQNKYGPFGNEIGKYFASWFGGKIVGFHGRGSVYLDAIGVHMEYF